MSEVSYSCPNCGQKFNEKNEKFQILEGKTIKCKYCSKYFEVQRSEDASKTYIQLKEHKKGYYSSGKLSVLPNEHTKAQFFQVRLGNNSIGRLSDQPAAAKADIAIKTGDIFMSKQHAQIEVFDRGHGLFQYLLRDLKSTNKVFLYIDNKEQQLEPEEAYYLVDGDHFRLGRTKLVFIGH